MAKAVRCLNCGQMSGKHSFPGFHCPDHTNKGAFLADQTMKSDIGTPLRVRLLDALGWQGGTVADALAEVRRLKALEMVVPPTAYEGKYRVKNYKGHYLVAGELNGRKYDGHGVPFLFTLKQAQTMEEAFGFTYEKV